MSVPAIEVTGLIKTFGPRRALDGLTLSVEAGSVYGFLGPNGAGKTTTLRILLGLARPTGGSARILGTDVTNATNDVRRMVGFLPDVPGYYPWMTGREFLAFCAHLFGLPPHDARPRIDVLLELAGLGSVTTRIGGYSRGMKQRLGIAQALINSPQVLLLDEPTSALDPLGRKAVLDMIDALRGRTTVLFSTHILADVERVCDTVGIVDQGRVVAQAPLEALTARTGAGARYLLEVTDRLDELATALEAESWVLAPSLVERDGRPMLELTCADASQAQLRVPVLVAALGVGLRRFEPVERSLEDVFVDLVGRSDRGDRSDRGAR